MTYIENIAADPTRALRDLTQIDREILKRQEQSELELERILLNGERILLNGEHLLLQQEKTNAELARLAPLTLRFYSNQFFVYGTTTSGTILGPWNLEHYTTLSGYLQSSAYNLTVRVDYRDLGEQFIGLDEWMVGAVGANKGIFSSFHLPLLGPNVRMRFQGQTEGNATLTLQADTTRGLPKYAASESPFSLVEASITASGAADFAINEIVGGMVNYTLTVGGGGNAAFVLYCIPPNFGWTEQVFAQVGINPTAIASYSTQGQVYIPPYPTRIRLYNLGASTQTVQCFLSQT